MVPAEACAPGQTPGADDEFDGTKLDTCRWSTILNKTATGVAVADGQLRINAQSGDLSGGAVDAKNMVLQTARPRVPGPLRRSSR